MAWIDKWDRFYDPPRVAEIIAEADPTNFSNDYVVTCCQFGAVLGEVLRDQEDALDWLYAWPYWESSLMHPRTGTVIPVFHWAIKKMSAYGIDDGFSAKILACRNLLEQE